MVAAGNDGQDACNYSPASAEDWLVILYVWKRQSNYSGTSEQGTLWG